MASDDTETEFFRRRGSAPGRAARARARREERQRLQPLRSSDPADRSRAATTLVEEGLDRNASVLSDFARDERDPGVLAALAEAVLTAPVAADPDRPEARLRDWALVQATRTGGPPVAPEPAAAPIPPAPAPAPAPAAPPPPVVGGRSPDDRWRTGSVPSRPDPPAPAPAQAAPEPAAPAAPPVIGGTIGNGSRPRVVVAPREPAPAAAAPAPPPPEPSVPAAGPAPAAAPAPAVRPASGGPARPSTWRVVKARPVDIVVWDPVDPAEDAGTPQPAAPPIR